MNQVSEDINVIRILHDKLLKALKNGKSEHYVKTLVEMNPQVTDSDNLRSPLEFTLCLDSKPSSGVIDLLLRHRRDRRDVKHLVLACNNDCSFDVIQSIGNYISDYDCLKSTETPLSLACLRNASFDVIQYLANKSPFACLITASNQQLPYKNVQRSLQEKEIRDFLKEMTQDVAYAYLELISSVNTSERQGMLIQLRRLNSLLDPISRERDLVLNKGINFFGFTDPSTSTDWLQKNTVTTEALLLHFSVNTHYVKILLFESESFLPLLDNVYRIHRTVCELEKETIETTSDAATLIPSVCRDQEDE